MSERSRRHRRRHVGHRPAARRDLRRPRPGRRHHRPRRRPLRRGRGRDRRAGRRRRRARSTWPSPRRSPPALARRRPGRPPRARARSSATRTRSPTTTSRRAIRLVTLKLVGYTEVVHALAAAARRPTPSILLFGGQALRRPYPGSTTVTTVNGGVDGPRAHARASSSRRSASTRSTRASSATARSGRASRRRCSTRTAARTPIGRLVTMDEIVDASIFLLENGGVNGVNLEVDGGWLLAMSTRRASSASGRWAGRSPSGCSTPATRSPSSTARPAATEPLVDARRDAARRRRRRARRGGRLRHDRSPTTTRSRPWRRRVLAGARPGDDAGRDEHDLGRRVARGIAERAAEARRRLPARAGQRQSRASSAAARPTLFVSGPPRTRRRGSSRCCRRSRPTVRYVGEGERARVVKLVLQVLIGGTAELLAEAVVLGEAGRRRARRRSST